MISIRQAMQFDSGFDLDVDLALDSGVTAIFGASGSGKTTLLRCIAGLEPRAAGEITVGTTVWQDGAMRLPPHQRRVGYVFQDSNLFDHLSVGANIDYAERRAHGENSIDRAPLLNTLNLEHLLTRSPARLSGGERQRVAIARALMSQPSVLLMDEPLAALDRTLKSEVLPYLEAVIEELELPVVYVSHSLDELTRLAETLVLMAHGRVLASGPLTDVLTDAAHQPLFGDEAGVVLTARPGPSADDEHLWLLDVDGREIALLNAQPRPERRAFRLRIFARDVSIALADHQDTSLLNRLPATIEHIDEDASGSAIVTLRLDNQRLLARVTQRSVGHLALEPGMQVWAQVKAIALLR